MKVVLDEGAFMPTRAHEHDAGLDLYSPICATVAPNDAVIIDTGVHMEIPADHVGLIRSKSGLMVNHDLTSDGTVDCGFTGSIRVKLFNHGKWHYAIQRGDKISQIVITPIIRPTLERVDKLDDTERGSNGFGSTGRGIEEVRKMYEETEEKLYEKERDEEFQKVKEQIIEYTGKWSEEK